MKETIIIHKKFYVYELWCPIKNEPFYVGKGKNNRCYEHIKQALGYKKADKNKHKYYKIKKIIKSGNEVDIRIVFESDNENDAFEKEKDLIKKYGRRDLKTGSLTNHTNGGDGASGRIFSKRQKELISKRVKGSGNPMYGKKHTEEIKKHMALCKIGKPGTKHTEEWRKHLKENNPGGIATAVPIYQIDTNGVIINRWPSANCVAKKLNLRKTNICTSLSKPHTVGGFYWRKASEIDTVVDLSKYIDDLNAIRLKPRGSKKIIQYDKDNSVVKVWDSCIDVKRKLGIDNAILSNILRGKRKTNYYLGWFWKAA